MGTLPSSSEVMRLPQQHDVNFKEGMANQHEYLDIQKHLQSEQLSETVRDMNIYEGSHIDYKEAQDISTRTNTTQLLPRTATEINPEPQPI